MASIGAAWAIGLPWDTIRRGLAGFVNDSDNAPGRFNVMDYRGATLIADYGHNPDAIPRPGAGRAGHAGGSAAWSSAARATGATRTSPSKRASWGSV